MAVIVTVLKEVTPYPKQIFMGGLMVTVYKITSFSGKSLEEAIGKANDFLTKYRETITLIIGSQIITNISIDNPYEIVVTYINIEQREISKP